VNEHASDPGMNANDRTLLIRVDVKLSNLIESFEEFKKERISRIEARLDAAEEAQKATDSYWSKIIGGLIVVQALVYILPHFIK
jgi:hypothetical protein